MRIPRFPAALVATVALLSGCASRPSIISEWTWTGAARAPQAVALSALAPPGTRQPDAGWTASWTAAPAGLRWTDETLRLLVKYQQNPLRAARALTLAHVAMHDARALAAASGIRPELHAAAIHRAAGMVLAHLYPAEIPGRLEAMGVAGAVAVGRAADAADPEFALAYAAGSGAGDAVIRRALADGSGRVWPVRLRPAERAGGWRAAPPLNMYDPAEAFAGEWRTWVIANGAEIAPPPPVEYGSEAYWREAREVLDVTRALTSDQKRIADDWHLDAGSLTPAGVWNRHALQIARENRLDDAQTVRLFAALNVAMMDSLVACWNAKMKWWTQRPVNAIRDRFDPAFLPHLVTPPFPSYVSGHAAISGAAARVLSDFFPARAGEFAAMAREAAESRLYGGIHFRSDNEQGLILGQRVGAAVIRHMRAASQREGAVTTR